MSEALIEAVAKAIANADGWATTGSTIADYMPLARAALAAIEEYKEAAFDAQIAQFNAIREDLGS